MVYPVHSVRNIGMLGSAENSRALWNSIYNDEIAVRSYFNQKFGEPSP
jgi:hypothetical protein